MVFTTPSHSERKHIPQCRHTHNKKLHTCIVYKCQRVCLYVCRASRHEKASTRRNAWDDRLLGWTRMHFLNVMLARSTRWRVRKRVNGVIRVVDLWASVCVCGAWLVCVAVMTGNFMGNNGYFGVVARARVPCVWAFRARAGLSMWFRLVCDEHSRAILYIYISLLCSICDVVDALTGRICWFRAIVLVRGDLEQTHAQTQTQTFEATPREIIDRGLWSFGLCGYW